MLSSFPCCRLWQRKLRKGVGGKKRIEGQRSLRALCTWQQVKEGGASGETRQLEAPTGIRHEVFLCLRPQPKCFFFLYHKEWKFFRKYQQKEGEEFAKKDVCFSKGKTFFISTEKTAVKWFPCLKCFLTFPAFSLLLKDFVWVWNSSRKLHFQIQKTNLK